MSINYEPNIGSYVFFDSLQPQPLVFQRKEVMTSFLKKKYVYYFVKMLTQLRHGETTNGFEDD